MTRRVMYVVLWAYTAWYGVALGGSLLGVDLVSMISPGVAIIAGVVAGRRSLGMRSLPDQLHRKLLPEL